MIFNRDNGGTMEKCASCGAALFTVEERPRCGDCPDNGLWDSETRVYLYPDTLPFPDHDRDQCNMEWECRLGANFNAGCHITTCAVCGHVGFAPHQPEEGAA
jgi:hypothetical protein